MTICKVHGKRFENDVTIKHRPTKAEAVSNANIERTWKFKRRGAGGGAGVDKFCSFTRKKHVE